MRSSNSHTLPTLRSESRLFSFATILAAALGSMAFASLANEPIATQRSFIFIGGPLLFFVGLHTRLYPYLHDSIRYQFLPLPLAPKHHWRQARSHHRWHFYQCLLLGMLAILFALRPKDVLSWTAFFQLTSDFLLFAFFLALVEPGIAGLAAYLGRRFPAHTTLGEFQLRLSGGWTLPEASIHLYGPALGIALATLLAMVPQLTIAQLWAHKPLLGSQWVLASLASLLALLIRVRAFYLYTQGMWEAIPWLHEAVRSLAGPASPDPSRWVQWVCRIRHPFVRLALIQWLRLSTFPILRLFILLLWGGYVNCRSQPPSFAILIFGLCIGFIWLQPLQTLRAEARHLQKMLISLPLAKSPYVIYRRTLILIFLLPLLGITFAILVRWHLHFSILF